MSGVEEERAGVEARAAGSLADGGESMEAPRVARLFEALSGIVRAMGSVVVCASGGLDSALVLAVATRELGSAALGLTAVGAALPEAERRDAARLAAQLGARHRFVESHELQRAGYVANGAERCFHCKSELYELAEAVRLEEALGFIANGTNLDDLGDFRPGLDAARAAGVRSPLVEAGLSKADVRAVARLMGLDVWDKPAAACLASRIPYGKAVTPERLAEVEALEVSLRALGFRELRVRWHETVARLELPLSELPRVLAEEGLREAIVAAGKRAGFVYVALDLAGFRSGSGNEALGEAERRRALPVVG